MAFSLTCPKCSSKLKTATAIPLGRAVQCPKCKENFAVSKDNMEEVAESKNGAASVAKSAPAKAVPAPAKPAAAKSVATAVAKQKAPAREAEEEEENPFEELAAPSNKRRDDDDESPRSRKREDEDGERPRKKVRDEEDEDEEKPRARKKSRDDDEEDEVPRSRKRDGDNRDRRRDDDDDDKPRKRSRDDEDNDESPRSRKRRDDDDEDDDRPRRRRGEDDEDDDRPRRSKKKKKKKSNVLLLIGLAVLGLAGVGGVVFLCIYLFSGGGADKEMMAYMPGDIHEITGADIEALITVKSVKELANDAQALVTALDVDGLKKGGVSVDDVSKVLVGTAKSNHTIVLRFKKAVDKGKIASALTAKEQKNGDKVYYSAANRYYFFPKDDLIVIADKEETLKTLTMKGDGKIDISEDLQKLSRKVGSGHLWTASTEKTVGAMPVAADDDPDVTSAMKDAKGHAVQATIGESVADFKIIVLCANSEKASKAVEAINKDIKSKKSDESKLAKELVGLDADEKKAMTEFVKSADASSSGEAIEMTASLNYAAMLKKVKMYLQMAKQLRQSIQNPQPSFPNQPTAFPQPKTNQPAYPNQPKPPFPTTNPMQPPPGSPVPGMPPPGVPIPKAPMLPPGAPVPGMPPPGVPIPKAPGMLPPGAPIPKDAIPDPKAAMPMLPPGAPIPKAPGMLPPGAPIPKGAIPDPKAAIPKN